MSHRFVNRDRIEALDPERDARDIYALSATEDFPWDYAQALGLALFRTYAVPSIGELLARTGEFTERTQKRYDDTVLLMDAALEHGIDQERGRAAVRRINQMHRAYGIANEDLLYVLCTFIVVPIRWIDTWGWRPSTRNEREASAHLYAEMGRHMGIHFEQRSYDDFATFMDAYERDHFAPTAGGHDVATATLRLLTTFRPFVALPATVATRLSCALLDEPLLHALDLPVPTAVEQLLVRRGMRLRAQIERLMPPRRSPKRARDLTSVRGYPRAGRDSLPLEEMGTFPCQRVHE
ncbi:oxygenase MpaB family protein [Nocardioides sp.]|uniref:oxygenase MpaB family protein n=1 Tax=Nocardioides sp. TaxID=35761 RepID=UPI00263986C8|nr:oxygenase MpaB family protein [Nocardioides sp.]